MSISAKSAASTPPAPARIVTTASRWSYSPASRVRTSSSPTALRSETSSFSASARVSASPPSSVAISTRTSRSSMRWSMPVMRSSSALRRDRLEVTAWAFSGSSHRSGAADFSDRSAMSDFSRSRSVTSRTDSMVWRRSLISLAKSTATNTEPTRARRPRLPRPGPGWAAGRRSPQHGACPGLHGDRERVTPAGHHGGEERHLHRAPQPHDRGLPVGAAGASQEPPGGDAPGAATGREVVRGRGLHRRIADPHRLPQAVAVDAGGVDGVRRRKRRTVGGVGHPDPRQLHGGHVHAANHQQQGNHAEPEDQDHHLTAVPGVADDGPTAPGHGQPVTDRGPPMAQALHRAPPKRSTDATWVAVTGTAVGTTEEKKDGTNGSGTLTAAVTRTLAPGRRHGWASQVRAMAPSPAKPWSAKAMSAAARARAGASSADPAVT